MPSLRRRLLPVALAAVTSNPLRDARRRIAETRRRLTGAPHRVLYFHQVDDPYSQLAAQTLRPLLERYDVELVPHLVGPPPDEAAPERKRLESFARKDAADIADDLGLAFPRRSAPPAPEPLELAARLLSGVLTTPRFADAAPAVGRALWSGQATALEKLSSEMPPASLATVRAARARGDALRRRLGHYLGAMFYYAGEWYWGIDRLGHLEQRLRGLAAARQATPVEDLVSPPSFRNAAALAGPTRQRLEVFVSLRSPYSYLALEAVQELAQRLPIEAVMRPVLPMVMRGLPVPRAKQLYILLDTKREAERLGLAFGRVCDPVGRPVERAYSLFPWARSQGRASELLLAFARAAFAEGVDTGEATGLRRVVESAGLSWQEARTHLDGTDWREEIEANRSELLDLGLWGVPSFRLLGSGQDANFSTWGQDRLWRVEAEIRRRMGVGAG